MKTKRTWVQFETLAAALFLVLAGGCSDRSQPAPSSQADAGSAIVIEPHIGVGKVQAGMTVEQVVEILGAPDNKTGQVLNYVRSGFSVVPSKDGAVRVIMCGDTFGLNTALVKAFKGRTREGIGMNSRRAEVFRAYGEPTEIDLSDPGHEALKYRPLGLTFTLQNEQVHHIVVDLHPAK